MKTVVLGGYGNFGARICRALAKNHDIDLIIAGRDIDQATRLATEIGGTASAACIDVHRPDLADILRSLNAELVIHTAGPFQQQGYQVPLAVAAAGAHYIDLADGRRFVCDFPDALGAAFRKIGRVAISGASTVPALSSAVVDRLTENWLKIDTIEYCIAPAQSAPRGVATLAAVLGYCGAPIQVWQHGQWRTQFGWAEPAHIEFARMRTRLGSLCDIPDLELFPAHYTGVRTVMFRAALEIGFTQRALAVVAALRRMGWIKHPERFARLMNSAANYLNFLGSALGGMVVRVSGMDHNNLPVQRSWHISADDDHGPEIPCMAAILLARRLARNELSETGAYTGLGWLSLSDFEPEFAKWGMLTDVTDERINPVEKFAFQK